MDHDEGVRAVEKVVFSRTLAAAEWENARIAARPLEEVKALKERRMWAVMPSIGHIPPLGRVMDVTDLTTAASPAANEGITMRIMVFGANGLTGRLLVDQALTAGYAVTAVARRPGSVPQRDGLTVVGADVTDFDAVDAAIAGAGAGAVLSSVGVPFSRDPINVYSVGAANIIAAMERHALHRLVIVSSAAIDPAYRASDSLLFTRVMEPLFMRRPGRTLYEDLRRMEALVRTSELDWTIIRPAWLFNTSAVTDYHVAENSANGMYTARTDLAASMLAQLTDNRFVRRAVGVVTTTVAPNIIHQIWRESGRKGGTKGRAAGSERSSVKSASEQHLRLQ